MSLTSLKEIISISTKLTRFSMNPLDHIATRVEFLRENFKGLYEERCEMEIVTRWNCKVITPFRVPCLPSGMTSGEVSILSTKPIESFFGVLYFSGFYVPKVERITRGPSLSVPIAYKRQITEAIRRGDFHARVEVQTDIVKLPILIKEGDSVCIVTYYDALWYGFAHSSTSLAALLKFKESPRTLIFVPKWFRIEKVNEIISEYCETVVKVDGLGISKNRFDISSGSIIIGGTTPWLGSLEDTPDKFDPFNFYEQYELLSALLK